MAEGRELRTLLGMAGLIGAAALAGPASAQSSDTLTVLANVGGECTVTGATMDFGSYTGSRVDIEVPISFECNSPTNIAISMNGGSTGDPNGRLMNNGDFSGQILYELHRSPGRNEIWGVFPQDSAELRLGNRGQAGRLRPYSRGPGTAGRQLQGRGADHADHQLI